VPLDLFQHPYCRMLAGAILETAKHQSDALLLLQESGDPDLVNFISGVIRAPDRSGYGEFTELEAAKDLVLGMWRARLQRERSALDIQSDSPERAARERQRARLVVDLRALRTWASGHPVIAREKVRVAGSPRDSTAPVHAGVAVAAVPCGTESASATDPDFVGYNPHDPDSDDPDSLDDIPPQW